MSHYLLSMVILVAAGVLAWRARPAYEREPDAPPAADRATTRAVWALAVLGALTIAIGTAATASGPHAGGSGTGDVVHRLDFQGADTLGWLIDRHSALAAALGAAGARDVVAGAPAPGADAAPAHRLTRICVLLGVQGVLGIVQYRLELPAEIVWVHVALATLLWVGHRAGGGAGRLADGGGRPVARRQRGSPAGRADLTARAGPSGSGA